MSSFQQQMGDLFKACQKLSKLLVKKIKTIVFLMYLLL